MHGPPPHRRAPRSTLLTAGTARACPGKGKETAHSFHAVTAGGDAFSRRPPRTTDLPGQATIAPGLDALRWAGQCQELGGAVPCGTTRPRSRRTSRGTARCSGTPRQGCARSPWGTLSQQPGGSPGWGVQGAPCHGRPHLVLGQLDLAALQVEAQQRGALQLLRGVGQPLQQLLQLVLELPQAQQSCLQLVLSEARAGSGTHSVGSALPTCPAPRTQPHAPRSTTHPAPHTHTAVALTSCPSHGRSGHQHMHLHCLPELPPHPCPMPGTAPHCPSPPHLAADDLLLQAVPALSEVAERGRGVPLPLPPGASLVP